MVLFRHIAGGIPAVFFDFEGGDPCSVGGVFTDKAVKNAVEVLRDAFARAIRQEVSFKKLTMGI